jgi:glycosyltransferase involved in cell wall biosynthesis
MGPSIQRGFAIMVRTKILTSMFAGNFDEFKGPQRALEIIHRISDQELPGHSGLFHREMGPSIRPIMDKTIKSRIISKHYFYRSCNDSENYFKRSRILLFPSANEGLSTAMLEAMACQCVPITSDVGNQTEAAKHDYNSIVIPDYNDVKSFSENAIRLLKDKNSVEPY